VTKKERSLAYIALVKGAFDISPFAIYRNTGRLRGFIAISIEEKLAGAPESLLPEVSQQVVAAKRPGLDLQAHSPSIQADESASAQSSQRATIKAALGGIVCADAALTVKAKEVEMAIQYILTGKSNQNAIIELLNCTCREELRDQYLFTSLNQFRESTYWWMIEYSEERSHDALGDLTPLEARN